MQDDDKNKSSITPRVTRRMAATANREPNKANDAPSETLESKTNERTSPPPTPSRDGNADPAADGTRKTNGETVDNIPNSSKVIYSRLRNTKEADELENGTPQPRDLVPSSITDRHVQSCLRYCIRQWAGVRYVDIIAFLEPRNETISQQFARTLRTVAEHIKLWNEAKVWLIRARDIRLSQSQRGGTKSPLFVPQDCVMAVKLFQEANPASPFNKASASQPSYAADGIGDRLSSPFPYRPSSPYARFPAAPPKLSPGATLCEPSPEPSRRHSDGQSLDDWKPPGLRLLPNANGVLVSRLVSPDLAAQHFPQYPPQPDGSGIELGSRRSVSPPAAKITMSYSVESGDRRPDSPCLTVNEPSLPLAKLDFQISEFAFSDPAVSENPDPHAAGVVENTWRARHSTLAAPRTPTTGQKHALEGVEDDPSHSSHGSPRDKRQRRGHYPLDLTSDIAAATRLLPTDHYPQLFHDGGDAGAPRSGWLTGSAVYDLVDMVTAARFQDMALVEVSDTFTERGLVKRMSFAHLQTARQVIGILHLNGNHWCLAVIPLSDASHHPTLFYNSMLRDERYLVAAKSQLGRFLPALRDAWTKANATKPPQLQRKAPLSLSYPPLMLPQAIPQQENASDCGIGVVVAALHISAGITLPAETDFLWWRRAFRCLVQDAGDPNKETAIIAPHFFTDDFSVAELKPPPVPAKATGMAMREYCRTLSVFLQESGTICDKAESQWHEEQYVKASSVLDSLSAIFFAFETLNARLVGIPDEVVSGQGADGPLSLAKDRVAFTLRAVSIALSSAIEVRDKHAPHV
ncbi:hypothetical protein QBC47DRAFT_395223 [Echria macrotheca]|uniref:Ubiquitin-like protease family profile domain-containing protein n=1 Tax=Echria macrotheca TaxID=438768 RepID=A0AAJ0B1F3_9PEZI|nr:hypothetical protein QBC47DRAFT_395223 [Echria macrotheca]